MADQGVSGFAGWWRVRRGVDSEDARAIKDKNHGCAVGPAMPVVLLKIERRSVQVGSADPALFSWSIFVISFRFYLGYQYTRHYAQAPGLSIQR